MDIKLQSLFVNLIIVEVILDQVKNALIQSYYEQLGLKNAFLCWWLSFYFENMGTIFGILFIQCFLLNLIKIFRIPAHL